MKQVQRKSLVRTALTTALFSLICLASQSSLADGARWACSPKSGFREVTENRWEQATRPFIFLLKNNNQQALFYSSEANTRYPTLTLSLNSTWSSRNPKMESFRQYRANRGEFAYEILVDLKALSGEAKHYLTLRERFQDGYGSATFECLPVAPL